MSQLPTPEEFLAKLDFHKNTVLGEANCWEVRVSVFHIEVWEEYDRCSVGLWKIDTPDALVTPEGFILKEESFSESKEAVIERFLLRVAEWAEKNPAYLEFAEWLFPCDRSSAMSRLAGEDLF